MNFMSQPPIYLLARVMGYAQLFVDYLHRRLKLSAANNEKNLITDKIFNPHFHPGSIRCAKKTNVF